MALECFTEMLCSLFRKICEGGDVGEPFGRLPDCLIIDILSRLPAESLLKCRRRSPDLRALISSPHFTALHLSHRPRPMLLLTEMLGSTEHRTQIHVLGENLNNKDMVLRKLHLGRNLMIDKPRQDPAHLVGSCHGVLLFANCMWPSATYYILNPLTQEEVAVHHTLGPGMLCALYFCLATRQLRLLYAQQRGSWCQYFVYIFKTQTWRKIRSSTSFNFLPSGYGSPAVVNGALHWITYNDLKEKGIPPCANGIMAFKMDKEEFSAMPHPGSVCTARPDHKTMSLLVMENRLSFCHLLVSKPAVDIWILEDYETWSWNRRYKVDLCDMKIFPFCLPDSGSLRIDIHWWMRLFYLQDGELVFYLLNRGLLSYNLDHKTVKRIELPQREMLYAFGTYVKSPLALA